MTKDKLYTFTDQVVEQLRRGIETGRWNEVLPGRKQLSEELNCSPWTIEEAVKRLSREGLLLSPGSGRRRRIVRSEFHARPRVLRVMILLYKKSDRRASYIVQIINQIAENGHEAIIAEKTICDLGMDVGRIARFVAKTEADAWVVLSGTCEVLEWFSKNEITAFALFGRNRSSPLASVSLQKWDSFIELADRLVDLGHERIVILAREDRRKPSLGYLEQLFLNRLEERGILTGNYNVPDWGDTPKQFHEMLESLFKFTPPTALITQQPALCIAVMQHLSRLRLSCPEDVSLACTDWSDSFVWLDPQVTHIAWEVKPVVDRVVKWVEGISRSNYVVHKTSYQVHFVPGGTLGPAAAASYKTQQIRAVGEGR